VIFTHILGDILVSGLLANHSTRVASIPNINLGSCDKRRACGASSAARDLFGGALLELRHLTRLLSLAVVALQFLLACLCLNHFVHFQVDLVEGSLVIFVFEALEGFELIYQVLLHELRYFMP